MTVYRWLKKFTFQYGQIYYSLQTSLKLFFTSYLHSNMVRFIMKFYFIKKRGLKKFTFQYGQIYYLNSTSKSNREFRIYIPIWLDLLLSIFTCRKSSFIIFTFQYGQIYYTSQVSVNSKAEQYLHSNMVRFIIVIQRAAIIQM